MGSMSLTMKNQPQKLAGFESASLEDWYRYNYFQNEIDISGSGVENYSYQEIKELGNFSFDELDSFEAKDGTTVGSEKVRTKIANLFGTGNPNEVMITNGSNEALQLVIHSLVKTDDKVISQFPCYHSNNKIPVSLGCHIDYWKLNNNYQFEIENLEQIVNKNTKVFVLNFPHNPTGRSLSQKTLDRIVTLANELDIHLVWDAAFQELNYDLKPLRDPIHDCKNAISIGTLSKAYGVPGLRFGWIIAKKAIIDACIRQKDYGNLYVSPMIEFAADKILENLQKFYEPRLLQAKTNREIVRNWSNSINEITWYQPDGGVCGMLKLPDDVDDEAFCEKLLNKYQVLLVPGSCFDMIGHVRLGFGGKSKLLHEGLKRVGVFLNDGS